MLVATTLSARACEHCACSFAGQWHTIPCVHTYTGGDAQRGAPGATAADTVLDLLLINDTKYVTLFTPIQVEVRNAARLVRRLSSERRLTVPAVYTHLCSSKVLTMEWIDGCKVSYLAAACSLFVFTMAARSALAWGLVCVTALRCDP